MEFRNIDIYGNDIIDMFDKELLKVALENGYLTRDMYTSDGKGNYHIEWRAFDVIEFAELISLFDSESCKEFANQFGRNVDDETFYQMEIGDVEDWLESPFGGWRGYHTTIHPWSDFEGGEK